MSLMEYAPPFAKPLVIAGTFALATMLYAPSADAQQRRLEVRVGNYRAGVYQGSDGRTVVYRGEVSRGNKAVAVAPLVNGERNRRDENRRTSENQRRNKPAPIAFTYRNSARR